MATSIFSRKRDLVYLVYFLIHLPVMFLIDLTSLYPPYLTPAFLFELRAWQVKTYQDQFFVSPPPWFLLYAWMEALFHVPVSLWSIGGLLRNSPKVPLVLLVYALQTAITTATCIAELLSWTTVSFEAKMHLMTLYGPYLVVAVFMTVDMFARLNIMIDGEGTGKAVGSARRKKEL